MAKTLSSIVDIWGRPIESETLETPQTKNDAKLGQLYRQFADHPSSGLTPGKLATLMRDAEQGDLKAQCELAEDMEEKDAHIQSEIGKRKMALQGIDWNIKPPRNATKAEQRDCDMLQEVLEDAVWLEDAIFDLSDATLKSFSCSELDWEYGSGVHYITNANHREQSWFKTAPDNRNELRLQDGSYEGAALAPFGWITHTAKAKSGYLSRRGLVRTLAWPFLFKNYSVRDLAEFLEIYGLPIRLGKYPDGATEKEKMTLMRAVMSIGHNAGGIVPKGMEIDFQNAADGQSDPFMAMINWCEKSQSKAILGGTLTSQADGKTSTNALGNVHNEVRQEIRDFDLIRMAVTLTRDVVYPMYALNCPSYSHPRRHPKFEFDITEPEDIKAMSESLPGLVGLGMRIPLQWAHEKAQIPIAKEGEATLGQQDAPTQSEVALSAKVPTQDNVDLQVERLQYEASPEFAKLMMPVQEMIMNATSLTALRDDLLTLAGQVSIDELADIMSDAMVAAQMAGISDVADGV